MVQSARQASAWRIEGTLREFPKMPQVNAWFRYPVHVLDETLADIKLEEDPKEKWKKGTKKANESRSEKSKKELEEAFNILSEDGEPVDVTTVADYLDLARNTVYNRVKKHSGFKIEEGQLSKIEK